jgi:hypothetical protein
MAIAERCPKMLDRGDQFILPLARRADLDTVLNVNMNIGQLPPSRLIIHTKLKQQIRPDSAQVLTTSAATYLFAIIADRLRNPVRHTEVFQLPPHGGPTTKATQRGRNLQIQGFLRLADHSATEATTSPRFPNNPKESVTICQLR